MQISWSMTTIEGVGIRAGYFEILGFIQRNPNPEKSKLDSNSRPALVGILRSGYSKRYEQQLLTIPPNKHLGSNKL